MVREHAARIDAQEPGVQAWERLDIERALNRARALDAREECGVLQGAPVAIKDIIDVAGLPTRYGSRIYAAAPDSGRSAACVQALERAGAIVLGKSVTTEFAYYTPGKTRNPWNAAHTPGGSSMGSAAAVACGMAAGALGTQTNGSVVRPAAFCGVVGFKPSFGTVSNDGTLDPWPSLDHTGVFARSVADAALLASVIDMSGALPAVVPPAPSAPRLALVRSPVWSLAEPAQQAMLHANAESLERAGARIEELDLPAEFGDAHKVHRTIMAFEGARHFASLQRLHRDDMSARFNELLDEGAALGERANVEALRLREDLQRAFSGAIGAFDAILTPPAAGEAPGTLGETGSPAFCTIWTLLGVPALTIPVGLGPRGLPLGLQLVGRIREDERMLRAAAWCESQLAFPGLQLE